MPSMFIKVFVIFYSTFDRKIDLSTLYGLGHGDIEPIKGQNANGKWLELKKCLPEKQTGKTLIGLLPQKQSDLGLPSLSRRGCGRQLLLEILVHLLK